MERKFEHLNHPDIARDGIQYYSVHEVFTFPEIQYVRVADWLTLEQADAYIAERGVWND